MSRLRYSVIWWSVGVAGVLFVSVLSLWPLPPDPSAPPGRDLVLHLLAWSLLSGWFAQFVRRRFALLAVGLLAVSQPQTAMLKSSGWLFFIGILIFSGSLYLLSVTGIRWLGAVTPLGGLAFIAGWACLAATGWKLLL